MYSQKMKQIEEKYIHAKVYEKNKFELKFSSVHVTVCGLLLKKENGEFEDGRILRLVVHTAHITKNFFRNFLELSLFRKF